MERPTIYVIGRDARSQRALESALGNAFDLVDQTSLANLIVAPLGTAGTVRGGDAGHVFTYIPEEQTDVPRALRDGALYCIAEPIDPHVLRAVVARCVEERARMRTNEQHAHRWRQDLARAANLQRAMLPEPEARLNRAGVSVAVRCRQCAEVGGDLVDYAEAEGCATVLLADVAGHGVSAALLTTLVKCAFINSASFAYQPSAIVSAILPSLRPFDAGQFITMIVARIDAKRGNIEYVNAGHPAGWLFQRDKIIAELPATNAPLQGDGKATDYQPQKVDLPNHAGLLLYTDGLMDAVGDGGRFGAERTREILQRCRGGGATLLDRILSGLDAFTTGRPLTDDVTLATVTIGFPGLA